MFREKATEVGIVRARAGPEAKPSRKRDGPPSQAGRRSRVAGKQAGSGPRFDHIPSIVNGKVM